MKGEKRRSEIIAMLSASKDPVSGSELAQKLNVSRQVIVQDIALLKAADYKIFSTYKGYLLDGSGERRRVISAKHDLSQIRDELYAIVDAGGKAIDVFVRHEMYGELRADLSISSRREADEFLKQMDNGKISPLMHLTNGSHFHTIEANSEEILDRIEAALKEKESAAG